MLARGAFGSLVFKRIFAEKVTAEVTICEVNSLTYDTRLIGRAVHVYARNRRSWAFTASKTGDTYELISEFYEVVKADDVLDCRLHSLNPACTC